VRQANGDVVNNQAVSVRISILAALPPAVYVETHAPTTNSFGLVNVVIGNGAATQGAFSTINWGNGPYFIQLEIDVLGGSNYAMMGSQQLMSVPYALYAETSGQPGTPGATGPTGADGTNGAVGATGATASQGIQGVAGNNGSDGTDGTDGATGPTGLQGIQGVAGNDGVDGANGTDGATGPTGLQGIQGIAGNNGIDGADGTDGATGLTGLQGIQGVAGIDGTNGTNGAVGATGPTGPTGLTGVAGPTGAQGNQGSQGLTGAAGTNGVDGAVGATGLTGAAGTNGVDGAVGATGLTGAAGTNGTNGAVGATGTFQSGTVAGEMQYWNGTAWVTVAVTANEAATLQMIGGVPTWTGGTPPTPNVTNATTGKIWMDRNLGASQVATSSTDAASYGDLYQWGRAADGHQIRTSGTTATLSAIDQPAHGNFITISSSPYDWRSPQNASLWQGVSGVNNPCPSGYRLPTDTELEAERASWGTNNAAGAFGSPLKLPMSGYRSYSNGSLFNVGTFGRYWSSTVSGTGSRSLVFNSSNANMNTSNRAYGFSVRCLKD